MIEFFVFREAVDIRDSWVKCLNTVVTGYGFHFSVQLFLNIV